MGVWQVVGWVTSMPIIVLAARLRVCPEGMEGTMYALIMSITNLGGIVGSQVLSRKFRPQPLKSQSVASQPLRSSDHAPSQFRPQPLKSSEHSLLASQKFRAHSTASQSSEHSLPSSQKCRA
eukprot:572239-Rhodomonas_salina.1